MTRVFAVVIVVGNYSRIQISCFSQFGRKKMFLVDIVKRYPRVCSSMICLPLLYPPFLHISVPLCILCLLSVWVWHRWMRKHRRAVAFFHPQCSGMGGGERVLWCAVIQILKWSDVVIYTTSDNCKRKAEILAKVEKGFGLALKKPEQEYGNEKASSHRARTLDFVAVHSFWITEDPNIFPVFTLLLQNLVSIVVAIEACLRCPCDVFVESCGLSFSLPVARLFSGANFVTAYVHYPTMSYDMISRVSNNVQMYNNQRWIAKSRILTQVKLFYYHTFLYIYGLCGMCSHHVWCNSSWTRERIRRIFWGLRTEEVELLAPPTDLQSLVGPEDKYLLQGAAKAKGSSLYGLERSPFSVGSATESLAKRKNRVISLAQFRVEKDHALQVDAFAEALRQGLLPADSELEMLGSTRGPADEALVKRLEEQILRIDAEVQADNRGGGQATTNIKLSSRIRICRNLPFDEVVARLRTSKVALHTMRDEHFGITLVEFVAARLLCVCHNSGGPKSDILCTTDLQKGLLAVSVQEFASAMGRAFELYDKPETQKDIDAAIASLCRFPDNEKFGTQISDLLRKHEKTKLISQS
ncbi:unnamed protein product [Amoebophrya sp. A25]|nr:unnamed protein product [Amoebophrya sp. A25]|eukprot:GSA25T00005859001.1